jgi:cytochrome c-type biogenesis protein
MVSQIALSCLAGAVMVLSPCILPVLPLVLSGGGPKRAMRMSLGLVIAFTGTGLLFTAFAAQLPFDSEHVRTAAGAMLFFFGLALSVPALKTRVQSALSSLANRGRVLDTELHGVATSRPYLASLIDIALGATLGLAWGPCAGPILGAATAATLLNGSDWVSSGSVFLFFSLGTATVLILVSMVSAKGFARFRSLAIGGGERLQSFFGVALAAAGVLILTGWNKKFINASLSVIPEAWLNLITTL